MIKKYFRSVFFLLLLPIISLAQIPSDFMVKEMSFDPITKKLGVCINYIGNNFNSITDIPYRFDLEIPRVFKLDSVYGVTGISNLQGLDCRNSLWSNILSSEQVDSIKKVYPSGNIPVSLTLRLGDKNDPFSAQKDGTRLVFEGTSNFKLVIYGDNHTYKIGVVQVLPPGFDLSKKRICLIREENNPRGYYPIGNGDEENCSKFDFDGAGSRANVISPYSLSDILFSNNQYISIPNIIRPTYKDDTPETLNVYSLRGIGRYWSDLLTRHGIVDTVLGKNPKFDVALLPPMQKINTLTNSDHGAVKAFFDDAVAKNGLNLSSFDFIVYTQYTLPSQGYGFERSFAAGNKSYISFSLKDDKILFNNGFLTTVHEMGHSVFGLADLYDGLAIKYPEGVPDPINFPQKNACIMAKYFGLAKINNSLASKYETGLYTSQTAPPAGLSHFYTENPNNSVLCVDDIVKVSKDHQNPNCSVADFYAGKCVQATSLSYLSYPNILSSVNVGTSTTDSLTDPNQLAVLQLRFQLQTLQNQLKTLQILQQQEQQTQTLATSSTPILSAPNISAITQPVMVMVPTIAFSFSGGTLLSWGVVDATSCKGSWSLSMLAMSGYYNINPTATTSYTITCTGAGGSMSKTVMVSVVSGLVTTMTPVAAVPNIATNTATTTISVEPPVTTIPIVSNTTVVTQTQSSVPKFSVLSPVAGEQIQLGKQYIVTWNYSGPSGILAVRLSLYKDGGFRDFINTDTANDGQYEWNVPDYLSSGSDYQVRIFSSEYSNNYADSNKFIIGSTAVSAPVSVPTTTSSSTTVSTGSSVSSVGAIASPSTTTTIVTTTPSTSSTIATTTSTSSTSSSGTTATSTTLTTTVTLPSKFSISTPSNIVVGTSYAISWQTTQGSPTSVRLSLYKNGGFKDFIAVDISNTGTYNWMPSTSLIGSDYSIRVFDFAYPNDYVDTGRFSITSGSTAYIGNSNLASVLDSAQNIINQITEKIKSLQK